jgi:RNA polymerase sigma-70 factor (ECF subfamily)
VDETENLARRFEAERGQLRAVAYRMLGSLAEADDAVQEAWLRLERSDPGVIRNLGAWLTTVVARVSLDMLRARRARREEFVPEPIISTGDGLDPEQEAVLADSLGLALLVVLQTLAPAERLAFILHDMFAVPFDEIAEIVERSPAAVRQLASRARRRVRETPVPDADLTGQRQVVDAFLAAARGGDLEALVAALDPDVVLRADVGEGPLRRYRGARVVAEQAMSFSARAQYARPALVNGTAGIVAVRDGHPIAVLGFTVAGGRIVEIDILAGTRVINGGGSMRFGAGDNGSPERRAGDV